MTEKGLDLRTATAQEVQRAKARGVRAALIENKRSGNTIVVWEDGRIVHIPAEEIVVPDLDDDDLAATETETETETPG